MTGLLRGLVGRSHGLRLAEVLGHGLEVEFLPELLAGFSETRRDSALGDLDFRASGDGLKGDIHLRVVGTLGKVPGPPRHRDPASRHQIDVSRIDKTVI